MGSIQDAMEVERAANYKLWFISESTVNGLSVPKEIQGLLYSHCKKIDGCGALIFRDIVHPPPELKSLGSKIRTNWNARVESLLVTMVSNLCQIAKYSDIQAKGTSDIQTLVSTIALQYIKLLQLYRKVANGVLVPLTVLQEAMPNVRISEPMYLESTLWVNYVMGKESGRMMAEMNSPSQAFPFEREN
ncbi:hypothetical protein AAP_02363 [Ascosphaera apis ARSEF 7405]|uniref:Uncharacterized protein n=1 Tax=Ascosphaera apis ARSEF 7405 TaxID=392613 RepID=A0A168A7I4_9EURO|nr:hypothetical protein AAP_02363 [Ascosphaera apis ARSEF 7405]